MGTRFRTGDMASARRDRRNAVSSSRVAQRSLAIQQARARVRVPFNRGLNRRLVASKETGFVDVAANTYALNTTGNITLVNVVPQSAAVSGRVGKKILLKSLQMRGQATPDTTTIICLGAALLIYDRRPTGSLPAITDVLNTIDCFSFLNDANSGRFKVLRRWNYKFVGSTATAVTDTQINTVDEFVDLKRRPTVYKAAGTGAIGDIEEGALYLITLGSASAGTADAVLNVGIRVRFWDV